MAPKIRGNGQIKTNKLRHGEHEGGAFEVNDSRLHHLFHAGLLKSRFGNVLRLANGTKAAKVKG